MTSVKETRALSGNLEGILDSYERLGRTDDCSLLRELKKNPKLSKNLEEGLAELGFRRFSPIGIGAYSLAMHTTENQVVRIFRPSAQNKLERPYHPAILQPIQTRAYGEGDAQVVIEILPKVRTKGVTENHIATLNKALMRSGFSVMDIGKAGNVGLMDVDGRSVPVLIDPGACRKIAQPNPGILYLKRWLDADGQWLQNKFEPRREPSNVVTGAELRNIRKVLTAEGERESQTAIAIETGLYRDEFETVYRRAMAKHNVDTSFSELVAREGEDVLRRGR